MKGHVSLIGIRSGNDESKRAAEALASGYHRQHGLEIRIPRIFNTYGPQMYQHAPRVIFLGTQPRISAELRIQDRGRCSVAADATSRTMADAW